MVEGAALEMQKVIFVAGVRIPPSPPFPLEIIAISSESFNMFLLSSVGRAHGC